MPLHTSADHVLDVQLAPFAPFKSLERRRDLAAQLCNSSLPVAHQTQSIQDYIRLR